MSRLFGRWLSRSSTASTRRNITPLLEDLNFRGLVAQVTSPNLERVAEKEPLTVYLGVDPTARSLHAGNLLALMGLLHFHIRGHRVISLVGGATGSIGDPGGRNTERPLLSKEELQENVSRISAQTTRFFRNAIEYASRRSTIDRNTTIHPPKFLNNMDWLGGIGLIDFLRIVGKHAKLNVMIGRDSVKNRLRSEQGISFTEFSYQLLQAYDFFVLNRDHGCRVQVGGSDQWGNIVAGLDLIRRQQMLASEGAGRINGEDEKSEVFGLTIPLLLTSSGEKFGKSAGNAVWLDLSLTSVFDFYQFFMRVTDADVPKYLRMFTLLSSEEISEVLTEHDSRPESRSGQRKLAAEVTELVHGLDAVRGAEIATAVLFQTSSSAYAQLKSFEIIESFKNDSRLVRAPKNELLETSLTKISSQYGHTSSRAYAKNLIKSGGFYLNNDRVLSPERTLLDSDLIDGSIAILRTGKDNHLIVALE